MGHKVHPKAFRLRVVQTWDSRWFSDKRKYADLLKDDISIRKYLKKKLRDAVIAKIEIERSANKLTININAAKPGVIIGRSGVGIEDLRKEIEKKFSLKKKKMNLNINVVEVPRSSLSSEVVMHGMIVDIEKRVPFRRVMKQAIRRVERAGAKGVKIIVAGRLNGAEIARTESLTSGKVPLHTLRADIDYAHGVANTIYGAIGIKIWIYKGEVFKKDKEK